MLPKITPDERRKSFIDSIDWISVVNNCCSFDDFLSTLSSSTNVRYSVRYIKSHKYIVIDKKDYNEFISFFEHNPNICRITRIDIKFDCLEDFSKKFERFKQNLIWTNAIIGPDKFQTVYFNSRQSDLFCRFYDKQAESHLSYPLSRVEYEIKGSLCKQFSYRWSHIGLDDALNYLYDFISGFNYRTGVDSLVPYVFYFSSPISLPAIESIEKREKFRHFLIQYRHSILEYCRYFGVDSNVFFNLCFDMSEFDKVVQ